MSWKAAFALSLLLPLAVLWPFHRAYEFLWDRLLRAADQF